MQKIVSQESREKRAKRNQIVIGIILILLMLFSTIGFAFSFGINGNVVAIENIEYKGVEFTRDSSNGFWNFKVGGVDYYTVYNPKEVAELNSATSKSIQDYSNKPLYFVGNTSEGFAELYRTLSNNVARVGGACLDNETCEEDYPIKDCNVENIIIIEKSEDIEEISVEKNCVYIKSRPENYVRYVDAYIFDLLGIKNE